MKALFRFIGLFQNIAAHNQQFSDESVFFSMSLNRFADMSPSEVKQFTCGTFIPDYEYGDYRVLQKTIVNVN